MTQDLLFTVANLFAGIGWVIIMAVSPFAKGWDKFVIGVVVAILALTYSYLNFAHFSMDTLKSFSSLQGVMTIFQRPDIVNACWTHILAIDLLAAVWIKMNSVKLGIKHWMILPSLFFTLLLGPLGFLLYLLTRTIVVKNYFADNGM